MEFYSGKRSPILRKDRGMREVYLFIFVSIFYKVSRFIAIGDIQLAFENAYTIVSFEKRFNLFYEIPLQQYFLDKPLFIKFLNQFYTAVHVPSIIAFFIWLYQKHRKYYFLIRNCFLTANFITLFIYVSFPCAPPRMLPDVGFVDTMIQISKTDLYSGIRAHIFNQYAAMPSMHFGTSLMIGVIVCLLAKNKVARLLMLLYPLFVLLVIVITGNHFFLDAIIGGIMASLPFVFVGVRNSIAIFWKKPAMNSIPSVTESTVIKSK